MIRNNLIRTLVPWIPESTHNWSCSRDRHMIPRFGKENWNSRRYLSQAKQALVRFVLIYGLDVVEWS